MRTWERVYVGARGRLLLASTQAPLDAAPVRSPQHGSSDSVGLAIGLIVIVVVVLALGPIHMRRSKANAGSSPAKSDAVMRGTERSDNEIR